MKSSKRNQSKSFIFFFSVFLSLFPFSSILAQKTHSNTLLQYVRKIYTSHDGLPQNRIRAMVQTYDGFLWIGTQDGLSRFDGAVFEVYDKDNTPELKHNDITSLYETKDSSLWIGTFNGLTQLKKGVFTSHPINTGPVRGIIADHSGDLWIGTMNKGIFRYKNGKFDSITTSTSHGLISNSMNTLTVDQQGNIWAAISGLGLNVYRHGQWFFYHKGNGFPSNSVRSFCVASDSTVWIGTENGLMRWKDSVFHAYTTLDGLPDNIIPSLYEDRSGTLWIGTERRGICQFKDGIFSRYGTADGLTSDYVTNILEDHEGSLWVGTFNAGLNQFWKGKFLNYTARDGVPERTIRTMLTTHDDIVWIGTEGGGVLYFDGKKFSPFRKNDLPSDYIRSLFEDSKGNLWIGLRNGLARYRDGKFQVYTTKEGLSQNFIRVMGEDHEGSLWVGTYNNGVNRFENGRFVDYYNKGIPLHLIRSLIIDHSGTVWIGSNEGLVCWKNGRAKIYTQKDGLPIDPIFDMIEDNEHTIWMGSYGDGLVRMKDGIITQYTVTQGLSNDVVLKILEDNYGNLWLSSMKGITCISKKILNDFADGKTKRITCTIYNSSDGMIISECTGPSGCKTPDGRLWFPTPKGIVVVDPKNMQKNSLPPPIIIERVVVDRVDFSPYEHGRFLPGDGQVEFQYGAMSFIAPQKVNFRYILEGFETEWRYVGTRRGSFYTNLSPGRYNFRVTACNSDGIWNETGASFAFELKPHFHQTFWFYSFIVIATGGIVFGIYRLRVMQLLKRKKELEQHVFERTVQLQATNKELEAFSYSVSHDLRAPLRSIDGFSNALLEDYAHIIDENGKDYLRRVRTASQHLEKLIDDMLKLSRVTRGEIYRTAVDLSTLAQSIAKRLQTDQIERQVEFVIEPGLIVRADENLMRIVLENLLGNAWKFTSKHPTAKIEVRSDKKDGRKIYFVRDDGAGYDMIYTGKLFSAFQRMHSNEEFEGTGIGLATVQRIIHRHGGRIWAEASIEKGATFYFTLPE